MSNEIARLETMPTWAREQVAAYNDAAKYDLLLPALPVNSELGYGYKPSVSIVQISPNPLDGEVFPVGSRWEGAKGSKVEVELFSYAKPGLLKLASAAGIQIRTERVDSHADPDYCEVRALGAMRTETGQPMMRTATKAFYMPDVSAEAWRTRVKRNKPGQYQKTEVELRSMHEGEMLSFRKHLLRRTEAGAITAVIRELLGLKGSQTAAQIARPKVLIRVDFRPDHTDPIVQRFLLEQSSQATRALYGGAPVVASHAEVVHEVEADDETRTAREHAAAALTAGPKPPAPKPEPTEDELIAEVEKGCDLLGLGLVARNKLFTDNGGDFRKMLAELNTKMEADQAGGNV